MTSDPIKTKFIVASDTGISQLQELAKTRFQERFSDTIKKEELDKYIESRFNEQTLITELNDFSNQCLIVYSGDKPAGFALFSDKGDRPESLSRKRVKHLVSFEILQAFKNTGAMQYLMDKCIFISKHCDALWLTEAHDSEMLAFFNSCGFSEERAASHLNSLPVPSVVLIKHF